MTVMRGTCIALAAAVAVACGGGTSTGTPDSGVVAVGGNPGLGGASTGGGVNAATGGMSGGTGGANAGAGGDDGTGGIDCVPMAYCADETTLEDNDPAREPWIDPPCDFTTIACDHGCVENDNYAWCAVECGGTVCPVSPGMHFWRDPCCTADGACGYVDHGWGATCHRFDWPGVADPDCPALAWQTGCCLPGNVCGVMWSTPASLGCVGIEFNGGGTPTDCDGNPIAQDAGADAAPGDASPD